MITAEDFASAEIPVDSVIVAVTENYTLPGMDFDRSLQVKIVRELDERAADRLVVVALCDPYQLGQFAEIDAFVCSFSYRPCAAEVAAELLLGKTASRGQTPVTVPGTDLAATTI